MLRRILRLLLGIDSPTMLHVIGSRQSAGYPLSWLDRWELRNARRATKC